MKKHISILALLGLTIIAIFYACNKQEQSVTPGNRNDVTIFKSEEAHQLRLAIIELPSDEQRNMFRDLSAEDKSAVWLDKMENVFAQSWNDVQLSLLMEMNSIISPELFIADTEEREYMLNEFYPSWLESAYAEFTYDEARRIGAFLDDFNNQPVPGETPDCECASNDDWCFRSTCYDQGQFCGGSDSGCGWFWLVACDGLCSGVNPSPRESLFLPSN
jgi:hypothetical protein